MSENTLVFAWWTFVFAIGAAKFLTWFAKYSGRKAAQIEDKLGITEFFSWVWNISCVVAVMVWLATMAAYFVIFVWLGRGLAVLQ